MKSRMRKVVCLVLALSMVAAMLVGCGKDDDNSGSSVGEDGVETVTFSYWQMYGEDSFYYETYADNPVWKYISENYTFNGKKIEIEFFNPIKGAERDNFNTLLATDEYMDIIDLMATDETAASLYQEGYLMDLTELVQEHMPNYMNFLSQHPECDQAAWSIVDGEKKILQLYTFRDMVPQHFEGFCYRRDWIAKYGTNPQTGEPFTYGFTDPNDVYSWEDNVIFPNGTDEPIYISDWEWMFEIFEKAMADLGIDDGYCISIQYQGYSQLGDLNSGFGGGNPLWHVVNGDTIEFGATSDDFRTYIQAMKNWYDQGWLDKAFAEHSSDMFYAIDPASVFSGKVGMWQGRRSTTGAQLDTGDNDNTDGIMVYGCRQPINDVYGGAEQQGKTPDAFYQYSKVSSSLAITNKAEDKDVVAFLKLVDFLYSDEGCVLQRGLTAEQIAETQDEFAKKFNMEEGSYYTVEIDGVTKYARRLEEFDQNLINAARLNRFSAVLERESMNAPDLDRYTGEAVAAWDYYTANAVITKAMENQLTSEEAASINKIKTNIVTYMDKNVAMMITGDGYDVNDDEEWEAYSKMLNKYGPEKITKIYQRILDVLNQG